MLQQTPANRAVTPWLDWVARWPGSAELAAAKPADVLRQWGRLGYPGRALRLQQTAVAIEVQHGGQVPADESALRQLPGVGEYTAAAVMAFGFGRRSTVLDTNVRRVIARVWHGDALPRAHITRAERDFAAELVPRNNARAAEWAAAAMELGAVLCRARSPLCDKCPVSGECAWFLAGRPEATGRRRVAPFAGTDRQVRGIVLQQLRQSSRPIAIDGLAWLWHDQEQLDRAINSLVSDGLAERTSTGRLRLPR
jgi:A/G-specific adenine glycosylase